MAPVLESLIPTEKKILPVDPNHNNQKTHVIWWLLFIAFSATGGTQARATCVFPFTFRGVTYTSCITVTNGGTAWCAVTNNYPVDRRWGNCDNPSEYKDKLPPSSADHYLKKSSISLIGHGELVAITGTAIFVVLFSGQVTAAHVKIGHP